MRQQAGPQGLNSTSPLQPHNDDVTLLIKLVKRRKLKLHILTLIGVVLFISSPQGAVFTNMTEPGRIPEALGQTKTGTLRGTVTDSSGAVVPGVRVTLQLPKGGQRVTTSSADGSYRFDNIE